MESKSDAMQGKADLYTPGPNAIDISSDQDKGVLKEILVPGVGDECPQKGNRVSVHYTGKLLDGTQFDSSLEKGEMFQFNLGKNEVIKAWDIGVASMKKGEKCMLTCQPEYAYGEAGNPPVIPKNATLVFEVELFDWEMEDISPDFSKGILRSILKEGSGFISPEDENRVDIHLVGKYENKTFEERDVSFELGLGSEYGVVEGVEIALKKFSKGEKSRLILSPQYAFGEKGNFDLNVPPNSSVTYEVFLKTFEKDKETWNMSSEEKIEMSEIMKAKGTDFFKKGKFQIASKQYQKIIKYLGNDSDEEMKDKRNVLLVAGYLNVAACALKLEMHDEVITNCEKALQVEPNNEKGLFRKGQAHLALNDYELAKGCFAQMLVADASNKAAQKNIFICNENLKKQLEKEKKMYQNIFKKMAESKDPKPVTVDQINQKNIKENEETEVAQVYPF